MRPERGSAVSGNAHSLLVQGAGGGFRRISASSKSVKEDREFHGVKKVGFGSDREGKLGGSEKTNPEPAYAREEEGRISGRQKFRVCLEQSVKKADGARQQRYFHHERRILCLVT